MRNLLAVFVLCCPLLLVGCFQPAVENGTLLQYPTHKIQHLYIDTSGTNFVNVSNLWPRRVAPDFKTAVPISFAKYGIDVHVLELKNEANLHPVSEGDYTLAITFANGFHGSGGTGSTYYLDLFSTKNRAKIWSGKIFVSGAVSFSEKNMGEIVAQDIADSMNSSKLFSPEIIKPQSASSGVLQRKIHLSDQALEAFGKFKTLPSPKAFVVADNGNYFYESGQLENQSPPAERALAKCLEQFKNCRVIADGERVY
jgi:hypothetical protein